MLTLAALQDARTHAQVAALFGATTSQLTSALYGTYDRYSRFEIPKKTGGVRRIEVPIGLRRKIQDVLAPVLDGVYVAPATVHGFVSGKSVVSNANKHVGKRTIVNIDLNEFFHTISFKRVRGVFLRQPLALSWVAANVMAQACCCEGRLPMGGVTSPTLSNIVMSRLDKKLTSVCLQLGGTYTRYADDLTLSFNRGSAALPGIVISDPTGKLTAGAQIRELIEGEGFKINVEKFRVAERTARKVVTGIVVNKTTNVRRKWFRQLESAVYAVEKFGAAHVAADVYPALPADVGAHKILRQLHGRVAYLFMVRGRGDWIAADLAHRFNSISANPRLKVPAIELVSEKHRITRPLLVVTVSKVAGADPAEWDGQGTGFVRSDGMIVTGAHTLFDGDTKAPYPNIMVRRYLEPGALHPCKIVHLDAHRDLAFLQPVKHNADLLRHRFRLDDTVTVGMDVTSVGFPDYSFGHDVSKQQHHLTLVKPAAGVLKARITGDVAGGLSGAPVVDSASNVVGVVHRGVLAGGYANEFIVAAEVLASFPLT